VSAFDMGSEYIWLHTFGLTLSDMFDEFGKRRYTHTIEMYCHCVTVCGTRVETEQLSVFGSLSW